MRYEKSYILHNLVFQLTLAAFILGALLLLDAIKPELAGTFPQQGASSVAIITNSQ